MDALKRYWDVFLAAGILLFIFALIAGWSPVEAKAAKERVCKPKWPGVFAVEIRKIDDGDTVEVKFRDGPCTAGGKGAPCPGSVLALRLYGVDTPEKRLCKTKKTQSCALCPEEAALGKKASELVMSLVKPGQAARVRDLRVDPYSGRIVGSLEVLSGGLWRDVSAALMGAKLAVPYDPCAAKAYKKLKNWCS